MKLSKARYVATNYGSPPARGRGLKLRQYIVSIYPHKGSPPARGRGLKPEYPLVIVTRSRVAPRAGAWIETMLQRR